MKRSQVVPILRNFLIFDNNYVYLSDIKLSNKNLILFLPIKDAMYTTGSIFTQNELNDARIEGWQSNELIWEDKQWGQWKKVYIQNFTTLKVDKRDFTFTQKDGKVDILYCSFDDFDIFSKYTNENKKNNEWKNKIKDKDFVQLHVFYDICSGKPKQSILQAEDLEKIYKE